MSKMPLEDFIYALSELCDEIIFELRQQINYYQVSVYKQETSDQIRENVKTLRLIARLIPDDGFERFFREFEGEVLQVNRDPDGQQECSLSSRLATLLSKLELGLSALRRESMVRRMPLQNSLVSSRQELEKSCKEILASCRVGSKPWQFFHNF